MQALLIDFAPFFRIPAPTIGWNPLRALRELVMAPLDRLARSVDVGNVLGEPPAKPAARRRWWQSSRARRRAGRKPGLWGAFENLKHLT